MESTCPVGRLWGKGGKGRVTMGCWFMECNSRMADCGRTAHEPILRVGVGVDGAGGGGGGVPWGAD